MKTLTYSSKQIQCARQSQDRIWTNHGIAEVLIVTKADEASTVTSLLLRSADLLCYTRASTVCLQYICIVSIAYHRLPCRQKLQWNVVVCGILPVLLELTLLARYCPGSVLSGLLEDGFVARLCTLCYIHFRLLGLVHSDCIDGVYAVAIGTLIS